MLDNFCIIYIDNILIYSNFKNKHQVYVQKVFAALEKASLQVNISKCKFYVIKISYLKKIIFTKGIRIDFKKVKAI